MNAADTTALFENLVKQEWTKDSTIDAWAKWTDEQAIHCQPLTDALMAHADLEAGLRVLDIASGVGQPAFSIAKAVTSAGKVVATDLSSGMLAIAAKNAADANIRNIEFEVADVHGLPFADNLFDRVVSRLGLMYFWDLSTALKEMYRVLRPGGAGAFVVWGAGEKNEYFSTILSAFMQRKEMPAIPEDAPTPTRFADTKGLVAALRHVGFRNVDVQEYCEPLPWPGTPHGLYQHFYDMAVPLQPYIDSLSDADRKAAIDEIEQAFTTKWDGRYTRAAASFNVVSVTK